MPNETWTERRTPALREVIMDPSRSASDGIVDRQTAKLLACLLLFESMFLLAIIVWM